MAGCCPQKAGTTRLPSPTLSLPEREQGRPFHWPAVLLASSISCVQTFYWIQRLFSVLGFFCFSRKADVFLVTGLNVEWHLAPSRSTMVCLPFPPGIAEVWAMPTQWLPESQHRARESLLEGMIELSRSQALGIYSAQSYFASAFYVVSHRKRFVPAKTGFALLHSYPHWFWSCGRCWPSDNRLMVSLIIDLGFMEASGPQFIWD